ncbi:hypothetical protein ABG768_025645, partial [Culter alburnus]
LLMTEFIFGRTNPLITIMSFQTNKTFVHLQNKNEYLFKENRDFCPSIDSPLSYNFQGPG